MSKVYGRQYSYGYELWVLVGGNSWEKRGFKRPQTCSIFLILFEAPPTLFSFVWAREREKGEG